MQLIYNQLSQMGLTCDQITILQDKDGITVARVSCGTDSYILKSFQKPEHRREIANYHLLHSLEIPTIKVLASTDSALLLEDLACSPVYRLGNKEDMDHPAVAGKLAEWYHALHQRGYDYVAEHGNSLYDESDFFTLENIALIAGKTETEDWTSWKLLQQHFHDITQKLAKVRKTLTYNDFYYTNMAVARDNSSALMFDYNLLGKGTAVSDLRNVTYPLSPAAKDAFLSAYGTLDQTEALLDDITAPVVTLYFACQRPKFPEWAKEALCQIKNDLPDKIFQLLESN